MQNGHRSLTDQTHQNHLQRCNPGVEAHYTGSITLEVVFGSPDNFRSEELIFDIVLFRSGYHTLWKCGAALCIPKAQDARPSRSHHGQWKYRTLSPNGGAYGGYRSESTKQPPRQTANLATTSPNTVKRVRSTPQQDCQARQELD